jgi:hypothetical protein
MVLKAFVIPYTSNGNFRIGVEAKKAIP